MGIIDNNLHTVLPFYDTLDKQNFRRAWCLNDITTFKLYCPTNRLLPFQIRRDLNPDELTYLNLCCLATPCSGGGVDDEPTAGGCTDILPYIVSGQITYTTVGSYDYITYLASIDMTYDLPCGQYYLEAGDGTDIWYSEVITIEDIIDDSMDVYRSHDRVAIRKTNGDLRII